MNRTEGEELAMMTVITRVVLNRGAEPEWDAAMRERLEAAEQFDGWMSGQLLMPLEALNERVIVGVWRTRADWEAWHNDETFISTRQRLDGLEAGPGEMTWHEVVHSNARQVRGE